MAWRNIVVTQHCKVSMKMNLLVVQTDDDTVQIPIDDIGMVLFATTQAVITTSAMASLLERDIKVVFAMINISQLVKQTHTKLNPLDEYALCNTWVGRKNERTYYGNESCKKR